MPGDLVTRGGRYSSAGRAYASGLALHLTNPKAILFFGSLYAVGVPAQASPLTLLTIIAAVAVQSALVFHGYALLFSSAPAVRVYLRLRRWFEGAFALAFGYAGFKILTAKLN
jgi:threonine/homoserine/homoserine lactone efflux protein